MQQSANNPQSPLQALVDQVKMLDANISEIIAKDGLEAVIKDYICPILSALTSSLDQSFVGLNEVAKSASVALVTAEKTLAAEVLSNVADISNDLSIEFVGLLESLQEHIKPEHQERLIAIKELLDELQEQVEPWAEYEDDEDGDDEGEGEEDGDEEEFEYDDEDGDDEGEEEEGTTTQS
jgi:hypothetical protein